MYNLLRTDFAWLFRSRLFLATLVLTALIPFLWLLSVSVPPVIIITQLIGVRGPDDPIRNKLVVGVKRYQVYISAFIVSVFAWVLINISGLLSITITFALTENILNAQIITVGLMLTLPATFCATTLYMLISVLVSKRFIAVAACLFLIIFGFIYNSQIRLKLDEPEYRSYSIYFNPEYNEEDLERYQESIEEDMKNHPDWEFTTDYSNGYKVVTERYENQYYIDGTKRVYYKAVNDYTPIGILISTMDAAALETPSEIAAEMTSILLHTLITLLVLGSAGIAVFSRKNLP